MKCVTCVLIRQGKLEETDAPSFYHVSILVGPVLQVPIHETFIRQHSSRCVLTLRVVGIPTSCRGFCAPSGWHLGFFRLD